MTNSSFLQACDAFDSAKRRQRSTVTTDAPPATSIYGQRALREECSAVADASEGTRNHTLNTASFNLGQLVGGGALVEEQVRNELATAGRECGLPQSEINSTINSGLFAGMLQPRGAQAACVQSSGCLRDRVLTRSALRDQSDPEPLIENVLDQGTLAHIYGSWGSGKSFVALDWGACVASGKPWQGRTVQQMKVLYVAAEGASGYRARIDAWESGWQTAVADEWMHWLPEPLNLTNNKEVLELCELVRGDGYGFIIIDTLARCTVGADENSARDMGQVIDAMTRLRDATPRSRGVILDVHHTGKDGKTSRGSSAMEAGVDTVYFTKREGAAIDLNRQKRKDGAQEDHHVLKLDSIPDSGSCVLSAIGPETAGSRADVLRLIMSQHFTSTGASRADLKTMAVEEGPMTKSTFFRALSDLVGNGYLLQEGTDARPFYRVSDPAC